MACTEHVKQCQLLIFNTECIFKAIDWKCEHALDSMYWKCQASSVLYIKCSILFQRHWSNARMFWMVLIESRYFLNGIDRKRVRFGWHWPKAPTFWMAYTEHEDHFQSITWFEMPSWRGNQMRLAFFLHSQPSSCCVYLSLSQYLMRRIIFVLLLWLWLMLFSICQQKVTSQSEVSTIVSSLY